MGVFRLFLNRCVLVQRAQDVGQAGAGRPRHRRDREPRRRVRHLGASDQSAWCAQVCPLHWLVGVLIFFSTFWLLIDNGIEF